MPPNILAKSLYKIDEVSSLTGVKADVIRSWEGKHKGISPLISSTGQKLYEPKDIEAILAIKKKNAQAPTGRIDMRVAKAVLVKTINEIQEEREERSERNEKAKASGNIPVPSNCSTLTDSDRQKLILTKAKLSSLLQMTQAIQKLHDWN